MANTKEDEKNSSNTFFEPINTNNYVTKSFQTIHSETDNFPTINCNHVRKPWNLQCQSLSKTPCGSIVPTICTWKFINRTDIAYIRKHQRNKTAVTSYFETKAPHNATWNGKMKKMFAIFLWETFKFTRINKFSEKSISTTLGLVYLTHTFFLANPRCKIKEIIHFFSEGVMLHCVLDPPDHADVYTLHDSKLVLDMFHNIYIKNFVLLYLTFFSYYGIAICGNNFATNICRSNSLL